MKHEKWAARTCTANTKTDLLFKHDFFLAFAIGRYSMVLRFWLGECHNGSAPLTSSLLVTYEVHQGLNPAGHFILTPTKQS